MGGVIGVVLCWFVVVCIVGGVGVKYYFVVLFFGGEGLFVLWWRN